MFERKISKFKKEEMMENEKESENSELDENQIVSFIMDDDVYGIEIMDVQEIIKVGKITRIPNTLNYIEGVLDLRGQILPIIDLRKKFGLTAKEINESSRIIVLNLNEIIIGIIVDAVSEVLRVNKDAIKQPPKIISLDDKSNIIKRIVRLEDRLLILLDIDKILTSKEISDLTIIKDLKTKIEKEVEENKNQDQQSSEIINNKEKNNNNQNNVIEKELENVSG